MEDIIDIIPNSSFSSNIFDNNVIIENIRSLYKQLRAVFNFAHRQGRDTVKHLSSKC